MSGTAGEKSGPELKVQVAGNRLTASIACYGCRGTVTEELVRQALRDAGVVYGINESAVKAFAAEPSVRPVIVATGDPPRPGRDEWVELLFRKHRRKIDEKVKVDFRDTSELVSVDAGEVLAVKHPPEPGAPGRAVTGEIIEPPPPRQVQLLAGKGVRLEDNGSKAVALVAGRPVVKESRVAVQLAVEPLLVHRGDVCLKSGHLRFKGDCRIIGNVCEEMKVEVSGWLEIEGMVTRAEIICGSRLVIKKPVVGSVIRAGSELAVARRVLYIFKEIFARIQQLDMLVREVKIRQPMPTERIVRYVLDNRFQDVKNMVKTLTRQVQGIASWLKLPSEIATCVSRLQLLVTLTPFADKEWDELVVLLQRVQELLREEDGEEASIELLTAHSSRIFCAGDVVVGGLGCVSTVIQAGGNVTVKGAFKGGEILALGRVEIQELGSALGMPPRVAVEPEKEIVVEKCMPGAVLQVGQRQYVAPFEMTHIKVRLDKKGEIVIE